VVRPYLGFPITQPVVRVTPGFLLPWSARDGALSGCCEPKTQFGATDPVDKWGQKEHPPKAGASKLHGVVSLFPIREVFPHIWSIRVPTVTVPVRRGQLVACPKRSSLGLFLFSLSVVDLLGSCFGWLAVRATASVCQIGEGSHDHDRDDHSASNEGEIWGPVQEKWTKGPMTLSTWIRPWGRCESLGQCWRYSWRLYRPRPWNL